MREGTPTRTRAAVDEAPPTLCYQLHDENGRQLLTRAELAERWPFAVTVLTQAGDTLEEEITGPGYRRWRWACAVLAPE